MARLMTLKMTWTMILRTQDDIDNDDDDDISEKKDNDEDNGNTFDHDE